MKYLRFFIALLIVIAVAWPFASDYLDDYWKEKSDRNLDKGVILYDLEGYRFDVPLKYYHLIFQKSGRWPTPKKERSEVGALEVNVILPDLLPYSEETSEKFKERGRGDKLRISLSSSRYVIENFTEWFNKWKHQYEVIGPSKEAPGLIYVIDHKGPIIENDEHYSEKFFKSTNKLDEYFYIQCGHVSKNISARPMTCKIHTNYKKLKIDLYFHRKYLPKWREIVVRSMDLLDGFRVN